MDGAAEDGWCGREWRKARGKDGGEEADIGVLPIATKLLSRFS